MIGFINRADIPKLIIAFMVGIIVFVAGMAAISFLPVHGAALAAAFLVTFAVAFKAGEWAGEAIWNRIQSR